MANTPKKIKDPTEAALSAIQDALSARDAAAEAQAASPPAPPVSAAEELQWPGVSSAPEADGHQAEGQIFSRRAANDDRESIGNILRALQRRPAGTSYVTATIFAGVWVLAGLVLGWIYLPEMRAALGPTGLGTPVLAMLAVVFFVPIIFFYVLAHMAWRSQELRLITQSMADVAMRLAEPETVARESIVTVGQAIRREVAAMGDGVERGRDLPDRRENTSRETSQAISAASDRLTTTLNFKTDHIGDEFTEITANVERTMAERLERVTESFAQKSAEILDLMSNRSQELTDGDIETGNQLADTISSRVEEVTTTLKNTGDSLVLDLSLRGGDVVSKLEQTGAGIGDGIVQRTTRVTEQFRESAERLADVIGNRGEAVHEMLAGRLQAFDDMFQQGSNSIAQQSNQVTDQFRDSIESLADVVGNRGEAVREMLAARLQAFEDMFN